MPPRSVTIRGRAVATMVMSRAARKRHIIVPRRMKAIRTLLSLPAEDKADAASDSSMGPVFCKSDSFISLRLLRRVRATAMLRRQGRQVKNPTADAIMRPKSATLRPLRNCRLRLLYYPDHMTPTPAHTSRASARAAPAHPTLVMQRYPTGCRIS